MRNLKPVGCKPLRVYDDIVERKRPPSKRRLLEALRPKIQSAYARYRRWAPALERLRRLGRKLTQAEMEALRGCYRGATADAASASPRDRLYVEILSLAGLCAYCGSSPTTTLDHYLAKDPYPEYAIFPANLVPSCNKCNPPRSIFDAAGQRALIHPYFDAIPTARLLEASIILVGGLPSVTFRVVLAYPADAEFRDLYERHCRLLDLLARYKRQAEQGELADIRDAIKAWSGGQTRVQLKQALEAEAAGMAARRGDNDMRVAIRRAAAASDAFLDYCLL